MKNKIVLKSVLIVFVTFFIVFFYSDKTFETETKKNYIYSKSGIIEIYDGDNILLANMTTSNIISFISDLNIKNSKVISELRTDQPNYMIKVYNGDKKGINNKEKELLKISIYKDNFYIISDDLIYEINSDLAKKILKQNKIINAKIPEDGYFPGNIQFVNLAIEQLGNVGGEKFWSWYETYNNLNFYRRMEWCCVFISWLGYQTGYLQAGEIPMFPNVAMGVSFYKSKGEWQNRYYVPSPGDIIFFDSMQDNTPYHVGIVEKVADGKVYTIEGNYSDMVARRSYRVGSAYIYGYGTPNYSVYKSI